jgi:hypothetical protein
MPFLKYQLDPLTILISRLVLVGDSNCTKEGILVLVGVTDRY